ncbi:MAG TPA: tetratricopeptide repeat protein [Longimicrobiales bacterium]|nr:tetratricopeptide repeat protein [Longimicrobiales bacterium]
MSDVAEILQTALQLGEEERWAEMAEALTEALRDVPDDPYVLCWLGVAERELGRDGVAYEYFKRSWQEEPLDPELLAMVGTGLAAFDDPEAEAALRAAALSGPDVPMARLQYGAYLARNGMYDQALDQLRAAVELDPEDPTVHGELGIAYALKQEYKAAVIAMETALELAPDDSWTRLLLGLMQLEVDEFEQGAEQLVRAADERPEDAEAQVLAALASAAVGWEDAAQQMIARVEYSAEQYDEELLDEARDRIDEAAEAARAFLLDTVAPVAMRDRLTQPL